MSYKLAANDDHPTVFFDGVCGLCTQSVNWLLAHDPTHKLRFAPLQGTTAGIKLDAALRTRLDTLVFVCDGQTYTRTAGVCRILMTLGGRWRVLGGLLWIVACLENMNPVACPQLRSGRCSSIKPQACFQTFGG